MIRVYGERMVHIWLKHGLDAILCPDDLHIMRDIWYLGLGRIKLSLYSRNSSCLLVICGMSGWLVQLHCRVEGCHVLSMGFEC